MEPKYDGSELHSQQKDPNDEGATDPVFYHSTIEDRKDVLVESVFGGLLSSEWRIWSTMEKMVIFNGKS